MNKEPITNVELEEPKVKRQPNGKIARLPHEIRQKLNFRLRDGDDTERILNWLNGLPETKAILNEKYEGKPISGSNLSDWRKGGHAQWLRSQETVEETCRLMEEATELGQAGAKMLPERLGILLAARCAALTARLGQDAPIDHEELRLLYRLCQAVALLRRGNQASEWIKLENRRVSTLEEKADRKQVELFMKWAQDTRVKETLEQPELSNQEKLDILGQLMFGEYWNPSWRKWKVEPPYLTNEPPALKREREEEEAAAAAAAQASKLQVGKEDGANSGLDETVKPDQPGSNRVKPGAAGRGGGKRTAGRRSAASVSRLRGADTLKRGHHTWDE